MRKPAALKLEAVEPLKDSNPLAVVGGNHPPDAIAETPAEPTPYEKAKARIDDLVGELRLSADGAKVETQELCDYFANLEAMLRTAIQEADAARKAEKAEADKQIAEIQARYNLLIGDNKSGRGTAVIAIETAKKIQEPFLLAKDAAIKAEAERLRLEAEAKRIEAETALRASNPENLVEREEAEKLVVDARVAGALANRAENTTAKAGGTFGRSTGLRTVYTATMTDARAALNHYAATRREDLVAWLQFMADKHVSVGQHTEDEIPGFEINSQQVVR